MKLKVYGERNTGTVFLREILRLNSEHDLWPGTIGELGEKARIDARDAADRPDHDRVLMREALIDDVMAAAYDRTLGWKHGAPDAGRLRALAADTLFLVTVKDPYAWVASMFRKPHHNLLTGNTGSLADFVTSPWIACGRDNVQRHVGSIVELWNLKYRAWTALAASFPTLVVRYEDLLLETTGLERLAQGVAPGSDVPWRRPATVPAKAGDLHFYRDYYAGERWRESVTSSIVALVTARLDHGLVARLGYRVRTA